MNRYSAAINKARLEKGYTCHEVVKIVEANMTNALRRVTDGNRINDILEGNIVPSVIETIILSEVVGIKFINLCDFSAKSRGGE